MVQFTPLKKLFCRKLWLLLLSSSLCPIVVACTTPPPPHRIKEANSATIVPANAVDTSVTALKPLPPLTTGQRTYHIGNSLTDVLNDWLAPIARSAGYNHQYFRSTIPGAPTDWNWNHPGDALGEPDYRIVFANRAPIDHLLIQPFAPHGRSLENEADYIGRFYRLAQEKSPQVQLWVYAQWSQRNFQDAWSQGKESAAGLGLSPATTWDAAVRNQMTYHEALRQRLSEQNPGKPVLIVPAGLAMVRLKDAIAAEKVPGMRDFFAEHFTDDIHLTSKGAYLVALVHFASIYRKNPAGVTFEKTGLTPEQAAIYQQIAWDTVRNYRWSGVLQ